MACEYRIKGTDKWLSEKEFKSQLNAGLLDKAMVENKISVEGIKPNRNLAKTYSYEQEGEKTEGQTNVSTGTSEKKRTGVPYSKRNTIRNKVLNSEPTTERGEVMRQMIGGVRLSKKAIQQVLGSKGGKSVSGEIKARKSIIDPKSESSIDEIVHSLWENRPESMQDKTTQDFRNALEDVILSHNGVSTMTKELYESSDAKSEDDMDAEYKNWIDSQVDLDAYEGASNMIDFMTDEEIDALANEQMTAQEFLDSERAKDLMDAFDYMTDEEIDAYAQDMRKAESGETTQKTEETTSEERETILAPSGNIKKPRFMKKIDGVWKMKDGDEYIDVNDAIAQQAEVQYQSEQSVDVEKEKVKRVETKFAQALINGLESMKIDPNTTRSTLIPIPPKLWNATIDLAKDFVALGDVHAVAIRKAAKQILGKAVKDGQINEDQMKEATKAMTAQVREKVKSQTKEGQELSSVEVIDKKDWKGIREARIAIAEKIRALGGTLKGSGVSGNKIATIQKMIRDYAKKNLPAELYKKGEFTPLIKAVSEAKSEAALQNAFDRIDEIVAKHEEQYRKNTVKRIQDIVKDKKTFLKKINDKWKGKISVEAQKSYIDYISSGVLDDLSFKSQTELDSILETIQGIVAEGKASKEAVDLVQSLERKRIRATTLEALKKANNDNPVILNGREEVENFLMSPYSKVAVIIDGYQVESVTALNKLEKSVDLDFNNVKGYEIEQNDVVRANERTSSGIKRVLRKLTPIRALETLGIDIFKNTTKAFKDLIQERIFKAIEKSLIIREEAVLDKMKEIDKGKKSIFGNLEKSQKRLFGIPDVKLHRKLDVYTNGHVVGWWATMQQTTSNQDGKISNYEARLRKSGVDVDAVNEYMNRPENSDLKEYAEWLLNDFFPKTKQEYEPVYIEATGMRFQEGLYFPTSAESEMVDALNTDKFLDDKKNISIDAVSGNLKDRVATAGTIDTTNHVDSIVLEYIQNMEHSKQFIPIANEINNVFNRQSRPEIKKKIGQENYDETMDYFKEILMKQDPLNKGGDRMRKAANLFGSWAVLTTLSFKLAQIPKQFVSMINLPGQTIKYGLGYRDWAKGMFPNSEERSAIKKMMGSSFVHERYFGGATDVEIKRIQDEANKASGRKARVFGKKVKAGVVKVGMSPVILGDAFSVFTGGTPLFVALYRQGKSKGMDEQQAYEYALTNFANDVDKTLQTSRQDVQTMAQKSPWGRVMFTFKSSQFLSALKVINSIKRLRSGETLSKEEKNQAYHDMVWFSVSNVAFTAVSSQAIMYMLFGMDDDMSDEEKERAWLELAADTAQSNLQGYGLAGTITDWGINEIRGKSHFNNIVTPEFMTTVLPKAFGTAAKLVKGELEDEGSNMFTDSWDNLSDKEKNNFLKVVGVKNVNDAIEDWKAFSNDEMSGLDAFMNYNTYRHNDEDMLWELYWGEDAPKGVPRVSGGRSRSVGRRSLGRRTINRSLGRRLR